MRIVMRSFMVLYYIVYLTICSFLQLQKQETPIEMASSPNQALPPVTWRARRKIGKFLCLVLCG